jgi:hypothetical protein
MSRPASARLVGPFRPGWIERLVLAPLIALERSRGWRRRGLLALYLAIGLVVGVLGWRAASLRGLPRAPEPFDLARYGRVEVPDADNAMVAYRAVFARFGGLATEGYRIGDAAAWNARDWSRADPEIRRWVEDHREALAAWLPATDRPDALLVQPEAMRINTDLGPLQQLRPYVRLALLEGSRLEGAGDPAGAWRMYRAALRASRHAGRHGGTVPRVVGNAILRESRPRVEAWIERPDVTPELLRRAIADVEACRSMTPPASEAVRADYYSARATVADPAIWPTLSDTGPYSNTCWYNQFRGGRWTYRFLRREPERSARVLRLIAAGYRAQCDRPRAERPRLRFPDMAIYEHDARTPPAVRAISPDSLESWARDSVVHVLGPFTPSTHALLDAEAAQFDDLALAMAERAFVLERGRPARTYGELLDGYLKALPDGIEPQHSLDPFAEGSDPSAPRD